MAFSPAPVSPYYEPQEEVRPLANENWNFRTEAGERNEPASDSFEEGEPDISDLYSSDTTPLAMEGKKERGNR